MNKSKKKTINIYSPHPVVECYARIKKSLPKSPRFSLMPPDTPLSGFISPENFVITKKIPNMSIPKTVPAVDMFQTMLKASFKTYKDGTLIQGKMGPNLIAKYVLSICFSFMLTIPVFFLFSPFFESKTTMVSGFLMIAAFLILSTAFIYIFEKLSWFYSRGESDFLKNFLIDLLDAEEI